MLKKSYVIFCLIVLASSALQAAGNLAFEAFYTNVTIVDAENQDGAGGAILIDLNSRVKAMFRGAYTSCDKTKVMANRDFDVTYSHLTLLGGLSYEPPVDVLSRYRLSWRNSLLAGYSATETEIERLSSSSASDSGFAMEINTGLAYYYSQHIQFFVETGLNYSFYDGDFKDSFIGGAQLLAGVRYALFSSRSLGDY